MVAELEARTRDYYEVPDGEACDKTTLDYVAAYVAGGGSVLALSRSLSLQLGWEVYSEKVHRHLRETFGEDECETAMSRARAKGAHALTEEALDIVDAPAKDQVEVSQAASRARARQWTAERWNRSQLGGQQAATVSISIGSLHLDALRAPRAAVAVLPTPADDAEIVTIEDAVIVP